MENREIKFRAFDKYSKKMILNIENFWLRTYDDEGDKSCFGDFIKAELRYEVMQFTGLKDKNGKEIYEGDIVQTGKEKQVIEFSSITYASSGGQSYYVSYHWGYHLYSKNYAVFNPEQCEIIGNIYSDPELIKQPNEA